MIRLTFSNHFWTISYNWQFICRSENWDVSSERKKVARESKWRPVTWLRATRWKCLSLTLFVGIVRKSNIDTYWCNNKIIYMPFFGGEICRDSFLVISTNFHLTDNSVPGTRMSHLQVKVVLNLTGTRTANKDSNDDIYIRHLQYNYIYICYVELQIKMIEIGVSMVTAIN